MIRTCQAKIYQKIILILLLFVTVIGSSSCQSSQMIETPLYFDPSFIRENIQNIDWLWSEYISEDPTLQSMLISQRYYTITFNDDRTLSIIADCNLVTGSYSIDNDQLVIVLASSQLSFCDENSLAKQYLTLLQQAARIIVENDKMTILLKENAGKMVFIKTRPVPETESISFDATQILGFRWYWYKNLDKKTGVLQVVPYPQYYSLLFYDDGSIEIHSKCNRVIGEYYIEGSNLNFTFTTKQLTDCEGNSLEKDFFSLLSQVTSFSIDGEDLILELSNDAGTSSFLREDSSKIIAVTQATPTPSEIPPIPATTSIPSCAGGIVLGSVKIKDYNLPGSWIVECIANSSYNAEKKTGLPEHIEIRFDTANPGANSQSNPILYIIPVNDYQNLWDGYGNSMITEKVQSLQNFISSESTRLPKSGIPILPLERVIGANDLIVQLKFLNLPQIKGVRFISRFTNEPRPVTVDNPQLFYIFSGFTIDNQYLITLYYPITTPKLHMYSEVSSKELKKVRKNLQSYLDNKAKMLNGLSSEQWTPNLDELDQLIKLLILNNH